MESFDITSLSVEGNSESSCFTSFFNVLVCDRIALRIGVLNAFLSSLLLSTSLPLPTTSSVDMGSIGSGISAFWGVVGFDTSVHDDVGIFWLLTSACLLAPLAEKSSVTPSSMV